MKAPTVKFAIAHLHKHAFCAVQKYFIILLDGRVLFVSYLPSTTTRRFQTFYVFEGFFFTFITFSIAKNQSIKQIKITDEAMTSTITFLNSWVLPEFLQYLGN